MAEKKQLCRDDITKFLEEDDEYGMDDSDIDPDYIDCSNELNSNSTESDEQQDQDMTVETVTIRKKRDPKKSKPNEWQENISKQDRLGGKIYKNRKGEEKPARTMAPPCRSTFCQNSKRRFCHSIDQFTRKWIFDKFWSMEGWELKQTYVQSLVRMTEVKQKVNFDGSRRTCTYEYYLQFEDGKTSQVCKEMFCGTIGMPSRTISDWINPGARNKEKTTESEPTLRLPPQVMEHLCNWLKELPTVPSHYCRKTDTYKNKKFLYPGTTIAGLYKCYCTSANEAKIKPVSPCKFNTTFHESNYSIFIPRKDQCDLCISAKHGNIAKDLHLQHIHAKELAQTEKNRDKTETDIGTSVWTMDLQCVLMCPKSNASAMYYKQKLQIHNFTLFDIKTKAGYCYVWTELNGNLSSEMFAYLQFQHFENILSSNRSIHNLIIWSDGCGYQNRNVTIANMYIHLSRKFNVTVTQKYLVAGHTQMECDSMHSTIERKLISDIFTPREYIVIMQSARLKPAPYYVKEVVHSEVKQLSGKYLTIIRPGKKVVDPTVHELRAIQFNPTGAVHYKLNFDLGTEWQELPQRITAPDQQLTWLPLFENPLPINTRKFIDLQAIKRVLPSVVHNYYDNLPHV